MSLFDNGKPEEFLLLVRNSNTALAASGTLEMGANVNYLRKIVRGDVLHQFDLLSADAENTETLIVENMIEKLTLYSPL